MFTDAQLPSSSPIQRVETQLSGDEMACAKKLYDLTREIDDYHDIYPMLIGLIGMFLALVGFIQLKLTGPVAYILAAIVAVISFNLCRLASKNWLFQKTAVKKVAEFKTVMQTDPRAPKAFQVLKDFYPHYIVRFEQLTTND